MLIDCKDRVLIDYIDNTLDNLGIIYHKKYYSKYDEFLILNNKPSDTAGFEVNYEVNNIRLLAYINNIAKDFINKREHLERCLCLK